MDTHIGCGCKTMQNVIAEVVEHWIKRTPSIICQVERANRRFNNYLLMTPEEQKKYLKCKKNSKKTRVGKQIDKLKDMGLLPDEPSKTHAKKR